MKAYTDLEQNKKLAEFLSEKREQETLRKMRAYKLHVNELDILEEAGEL